MRRSVLLLMVQVVGSACFEPAAQLEDEGPPKALPYAEVAVLGGANAEGPSAFGSISAVGLLPDGVVVADGHTQRLELFSSGGQHQGTLGGRGGGPGEHRAIRAVGARPDGGLCTWDVQLVRITRFDAQGDVESVTRVDLDGMEAIRPKFEGFFPDCGFVLRDVPSAMGLRNVPEGLRSDTINFVLYGPDGRPTRTLARVVGAEYWFRNRDRYWGDVPLIFGREQHGFPVGEEFWFGLSDSLRWDRLDRSGGRVGRLVVPSPEVAVSESEVEAERRRRVEEAEQRLEGRGLGPEVLEGLRRGQVAGIEMVPARDILAAYDRATPAGAAGVWVRKAVKPQEESAQWLFLAPNGQVLGAIVLGRAEEVASASDSILAVTGRDGLDAPVVRILKWQGGGLDEGGAR